MTTTVNHRKTILDTIRQSLRRGELSETARQAARKRLQQPPITLQPKLPDDDLLALFQQRLEKVAGTVHSVKSAAEVVAAVKSYLQTRELPLHLVADSLLQDLPWSTDMTLAYRNAEATDAVSVTQGFAGIAETGSVMMLSSPNAPTPLNFLPEVHIVVLQTVDVVSHMEEAWAKLCATDSFPRTVNLITGPSRTADVEQTIQLGAHGPRAFHVVLWAA